MWRDVFKHGRASSTPKVTFRRPQFPGGHLQPGSVSEADRSQRSRFAEEDTHLRRLQPRIHAAARTIPTQAETPQRKLQGETLRLREVWEELCAEESSDIARTTTHGPAEEQEHDETSHELGREPDGRAAHGVLERGQQSAQLRTQGREFGDGASYQQLHDDPAPGAPDESARQCRRE